jgi:hypothetical protein
MTPESPEKHPVPTTRRRVLIAIASMVLAILYLPRIPGCVMSHTSKTGRVVDAETGKGVADAAVIATSNMTCSGGGRREPHKYRHGIPYRCT